MTWRRAARSSRTMLHNPREKISTPWTVRYMIINHIVTSFKIIRMFTMFLLIKIFILSFRILLLEKPREIEATSGITTQETGEDLARLDLLMTSFWRFYLKERL
jgi:hypothetical protein